jgi:hypothetical protein
MVDLYTYPRCSGENLGGASRPPPHLHRKLTNFRKFLPKRGLKTVFSSANGGGGGYVGNLKVLSEI